MQDKYEQFCKEVRKIKGVEVYDPVDETKDSYVECGVLTDRHILAAKEVIKKYGYQITEECECEGSDYPSYCIWFKTKG